MGTYAVETNLTALNHFWVFDPTASRVHPGGCGQHTRIKGWPTLLPISNLICVIESKKVRRGEEVRQGVAKRRGKAKRQGEAKRQGA